VFVGYYLLRPNDLPESDALMSTAAYANNLALYEKLVTTNPRVERKGATIPFTSLNGHMFSYLGKTDEMALRLPSGKREAFLKR